MTYIDRAPRALAKLADVFDGDVDLEQLRWNIVPIYRERMLEHATEFAHIATALRAGESVPMFAAGEGGVIAAEHLQRQFELQASQAADLLERLGAYLDADPQE